MSSPAYNLMDDYGKNVQQSGNGATVMGSTKFSDMELEDYDWLWQDMICRGKVHVIVGESGIGKTMILCNIASIISRGGTFPGTKEPCKKQRVLYLTGEDGGGDTLMPRLMATSADLEFNNELDDEIHGQSFTIPEHHQILEETIYKCGDVGLVIIDPITSFCGKGFQNNSPTDVRHVLTRLTAIAKRTNVAIICLTHLRKDRVGGMATRLLGAGAWLHGPRIVLGVMKSNAHGCFLLGKIKSNICNMVGCYPYDIHTKPMVGRKEEIAYADWSTDRQWNEELLVLENEEGGDIPRHGEKTDTASTILSEQLADGKQHPRDEIIMAGIREKISASTMRDAANLMGVVKTRTETMPSYTTWQLPN